MGTGCFGSLDHFLIRRIRSSISDIFHDGSAEQMSVLQHHSYMGAKTASFVFLNISSVDDDRSLLNVVKTVQKVCNGGLSGSGRTNKGNLLSGVGVQIDIF